MQTSPRGAIAHNVLLPRNFQIQISDSDTPVYLDPGMHSGLEVKGLRK